MTLALGINAGAATGLALLNCLVREISAPEQQLRNDEDGWLVIRLARVGSVLRARLTRPPSGPAPRLGLPIEERMRSAWSAVGWQRLADLIAGELELATGLANPEFVAQVRASHQAMAAILAHRGAETGQARWPQAHSPYAHCPQAPSPQAPSPQAPCHHAHRHHGHRDPITCQHIASRQACYLSSEQALVAGHRFHPSPKSRQGDPAAWLPYAPETRSRFQLRWLAVRRELIAEEGGTGPLDLVAPAVPPGFRPLPVHPWQQALLAGVPLLRQAIASGALRDLGPAGPVAVPTSSVRTVYLPDADFFCKFSLDVRITNCVRKNSWYELTGAVALSELLRPVFAELGAAFDGCMLLAEPGHRSIALADRRLYEGFGVIVRDGVAGCAGTPLLAGALADPDGSSGASISRLLRGATPEHALAWWDAYVRLVVPPVLHAYLRHGVVLEPHLQNVLVAVDGAGHPVQAVFRDLEGTKLLTGHWNLQALPPRVREALSYDADRGWNRVVYCLFVNHLAEIAAALADLHPELEAELWRAARDRIVRYAGERLPEGSVRLRRLLAGQPLPAKANLRTRWSRGADRAAAYVTVPSPFQELRTLPEF